MRTLSICCSMPSFNASNLSRGCNLDLHFLPSYDMLRWKNYLSVANRHLPMCLVSLQDFKLFVYMFYNFT